MTSSDTYPQQAVCPECHSANVLVVATTATVASCYCLACEHLFATEVSSGQQDAPPPDPPAHPPPTRALGMFRYRRAA
jgi:hypothetical protein